MNTSSRRIRLGLVRLVAVLAGLGQVTGGYGQSGPPANPGQSQSQIVAWGNNYYGQTEVPAGLENVVAIVGGNLHSLALKSDGTVAAWGVNASGETNVPAGLTNVVAIAGGGGHSLALKSDGTVTAWGYNDYGQTNVPAGLAGVVAIAAGGGQSLALKADGTVAAWGSYWNLRGGFSPATVPAGLREVVAIACGEHHCLALKADRTVVAWGGNYYGEADVPADLDNVVAIACGRYFSLALKSDGTVVAWGDYMTRSMWGEDQSVPMTVPEGLRDVVAIAAGANHSLALRADGTIVAWGNNEHGQSSGMGGLTNVVAIAGGWGHSLAMVSELPMVTVPPVNRSAAIGTTATLQLLAAGAPPLQYQWQFNGAHLPGATNSILMLSNVQFSQSGDYRAIVTNAAGAVTTAPARLTVVPLLITAQPEGDLLAAGTPAQFSISVSSGVPVSYQWQFNSAPLTGATQAVLTLAGARFEQAGLYRVVVSNAYGVATSAPAALTVAPSLVAAWGDNYYGQTHVPADLGDVVAIAGSGDYSLVLKSDGTVVAWGATTNVPASWTNVVAITPGLALRADGTVVDWGDNGYGQSDVPVGLTNVTAIASGRGFSLALKKDGTVVAWGDNSMGQTNVPAGLGDVVAISCGTAHALALKADGTVVAWGANYMPFEGACGVSFPGQAIVPAGLGDVVAIAGGGAHSLALRSDGTVAAWGWNCLGQTAVPDGLGNVVGIAAGLEFSLALKGDGAVVVWGDNSYGQRRMPAGLRNVAAIAAGTYHGLALTKAAPTIAFQPKSLAIAVGTEARLQLTAMSATPLRYQWQFEGANLPGATNPVLELAHLQLSQAGRYQAIVANAFGAVTSAPAQLTVVPLLITAQPRPGAWAAGTPAQFDVGVSSGSPVSYQWQFKGTNLPGQTGPVLRLAGVRYDQAGAYRVVLGNTLTMATSAPAILTVQASSLIVWGNDEAGRAEVPSSLTNVTAIASGQSHNLALNADGTVVAWGNNDYGQTNLPAGLSNVVAIACGSGHSLALNADGTVIAWGKNFSGQTNVPAGLTNVVAIAGGEFFSMALTADDTAVVWGDINYAGTWTIEAVAIAVGGVYRLALKPDGAVTEGGLPYSGERELPVLTNAVAIAAGYNHALALRADGTVVAWGDNELGQTNVPAGLTNVVAIAAGDWHSLALKADGTVVGWGDSYYGQTDVPAGLTPQSGVVAIAGGGDHSLALVSAPPRIAFSPAQQFVIAGTTVMLQSQAAGLPPLDCQWQFEGANLPGATNPVLVLSNVPCSLAGEYRAIFRNAYGAATSAPARLAVAPLLVSAQPQSLTLAIGTHRWLSVAVTSAVPVHYQWQGNGLDLPGATQPELDLSGFRFDQAGLYRVVLSNAFGVVTSATATLTVVPSLVLDKWGKNSPQADVLAGLTNVVALADSGNHRLALKSDGTVVAWGINNYGQTNVPAGLAAVVAIDAGGDHSLALKADGTVAAWGRNSSGQTNVPTGLANVTAIASGGNHSLALKTDGTVVAWGSYVNFYNGNIVPVTVPAGLQDVVAIAAGWTHNLALKADGTVVAWGAGWGEYGQTRVPTGLDHVEAIAVGANYNSLALKADGTVMAWGYQTNVPAQWTNVVAINPYLALRADGTVPDWGLTDVVAIGTGLSGNLALVSAAPAIALSPRRQSAALGTAVTFQIKALGKPPLYYQWQFNGTNLPGATQATLDLAGIQFSQAGEYRAMVTNAYGAVTSALARLTVTPILITGQPLSQRLAEGTAGQLRVQVSSGAPVSYQWQFNGTNLAGAIQPVLTLDAVQSGQAGVYQVVVGNGFGMATSAPATVAVSPSFVVAWGNNYYGQTEVPAGLENVVAIAGGNLHSLALKTDGTVVAWGSYWNSWNGNSVPATVPAGLRDVVAIAVGETHNLALKADGTVVAWGAGVSYFDYGQAQVPAGLTNVVAIAAGWQHSLALKADGTVVAWGARTNVPASWINVVAITPGLALRADGTVADLEETDYGQREFLGNLTDIVAIAGGESLYLALRGDGTVAVWPNSTESGQLTVPAGLLPPGGAVALAGRQEHCLALKADGTVVGWGRNFSGQSDVPVGLTNVVAIADGNYHSLALVSAAPTIALPPAPQSAALGTTATLQLKATGAPPLQYQWQFNGAELTGATNPVLVLSNAAYGQAGQYRVIVTNAYGAATSRVARLTVAPLLITAQPRSQTAAVGSFLRFGVSVSSASPVSCQWQFNGQDLPGATQPVLKLAGVQIGQSGPYRVVLSNAAGMVTSATVTLTVLASSVVAWGNQASVPAGLTNVVAIDRGWFHSLALKSDGTVVAWGGNASGQSRVPAGLASVVAIACGAEHNLVLKTDGTVVAWGGNYYKQTNVPAGLTNVVAIAAGGVHSLALKADGTVVLWGCYRRGDGRIQATVPEGLTNVVAIAGGEMHSLALKADGTVVAWGYYQCSDDSVPATVPEGLTNVVAIASSDNNSLALKADGTVAVWGDFEHGQLDIPAGLANVVAVAGWGDFCVAIKADGKVSTWGYAGSLPPWLENVVAIDGGLALLGNGQPVLTVQPASITALAGATVRLTVKALGLAPLEYQWQCNGTNLPGMTQEALFLTNVLMTQTGNYTVLVSNEYGAVASHNARLEVVAPPSFEPLPPEFSIPVGSNVTFSIEASGTQPLYYQWRKNGVNLPGATNDTFTITNVQVADGGGYSVVVANRIGAVASEPALLLVAVVSQAPPEDLFVNRRMLAGASGFASGTNRWATREPDEPYHAGKTGSNSVWYSWTAPAAGIAAFRTMGSTFDTLLAVYAGTNLGGLAGVADDEDRGGFLTSELRFNARKNQEYQIAVDGFAGQQGTFILSWNLDSSGAVLPDITEQPQSQTVRAGAAVTLSVGAMGEGLTFQWHLNGVALSGATGAVLTLPAVTPEQVGYYSVAITNSVQGGSPQGGIVSRPAAVEIGPVAGAQSQDKMEDVLVSLVPDTVPNPFAASQNFQEPASAHRAWPSPSKSGVGGGAALIYVGAGSVDAHILNNTQGTTSPNEATHCGAISKATRWLALVLTNRGTFVLDTFSSRTANGQVMPTLLAAYQLGPVGRAASPFACAVSNAANGAWSRLRYSNEGRATNLFVVDGLDGAQGTICLNWALGQPPEVQAAYTNYLLKWGGTLTLRVTVANTLPAAQCQWYRGSEPIARATNATLLLTNFQAAEAGYYWVAVSNQIDTVTAPVAWVELEPPLVAAVQSRFDYSDTEWALAGGFRQFVWSGAPGGHLRAVPLQAGDTWSWIAPAKFLGNQAAAYGGYLQFDLSRLSAASTNPLNVVLGGSGQQLRFACPTRSGTNWFTYRIPLREGQGWTRSDGAPVELGELQPVLAALQDLRLQGQFGEATETWGLDNVLFLFPAGDAAPALAIQWWPDPLRLVLEWPLNALPFQIETTGDLARRDWTTNLATWRPELSLTNGLHRAILNHASRNTFFRLKKLE